MSLKKTLTLALSVAAVIGFTSVAPAQDNYPNRPMELLIPFAAGGANDQVGRALAQRLEKELGQPVAPINRTGANGYVAAQEIVTGNPDGYKLAQESLGSFILTSLFEKQAVNPLEDLRYVAQFGQLTSAIAVSAKSPYQTLEELLDAMREKPGEFTWGHTGQGGFHHVNGVSLFHTAGVDAIDIPFQGSSASVASLMGGHIDAAVLSSSNFFGFENELRFLAFMSTERDAVLPDVPTVGELGIDMAMVETPSVLVVHKDTPEAIVEKLEAAVKAVVEQEDYQETLLKMGVAPIFATGEQIRENIAANTPRWQEVIDATREAAN